MRILRGKYFERYIPLFYPPPSDTNWYGIWLVFFLTKSTFETDFYLFPKKIPYFGCGLWSDYLGWVPKADALRFAEAVVPRGAIKSTNNWRQMLQNNVAVFSAMPIRLKTLFGNAENIHSSVWQNKIGDKEGSGEAQHHIVSHSIARHWAEMCFNASDPSKHMQVVFLYFVLRVLFFKSN